MKIKFTRKGQDDGFNGYDAYDDYNGGFNDDENLADEGFEASDFSAPKIEEPAAPAAAPIVLKIVNPKEYDKAKADEIADFLKNGNTVLLNIENLASNHMVRYLDYLSGATHALSGMMTRVGKTTIVVSPKNVDVSSIEAMVGTTD
jgi:SepF-like predicted cell division protein (DUF552 family)